MSAAQSLEPCGSTRVLREYQGSVEQSVWCERREGPCPWPGTKDTGERLCATSGARRFSVSWAPSLVEQAHTRIVSAHEAVANGGQHEAIDEQTLAVARDALAMCRSEDPA